MIVQIKTKETFIAPYFFFCVNWIFMQLKSVYDAHWRLYCRGFVRWKRGERKKRVLQQWETSLSNCVIYIWAHCESYNIKYNWQNEDKNYDKGNINCWNCIPKVFVRSNLKCKQINHSMYNKHILPIWSVGRTWIKLLIAQKIWGR